MSRARSELWQRHSREPYAAWARPCLASVRPLPSWSPKAHCYLKRSVRKDFSFPDHWQMFAQIYFGGISSTLLSFLPKELEEHFKNTFISLSFYPSVAPGTLPLLLSFCPSFFLDLLGCDMDFICPWHGKGLLGPGRGGLALLQGSPSAFLVSLYITTHSSGNCCRNFCPPSQHDGPLPNAEPVLTVHLLCVR